MSTRHVVIPELGSPRFTLDEYELLGRLCHKHGVKKTAYIRRAVRKEMKRELEEVGCDSSNLHQDRSDSAGHTGTVSGGPEGQGSLEGGLDEDDN